MLGYMEGRKNAIEIFNRSIERTHAPESGEMFYGKVEASIRKHGFLYMKNEYHNKFNAALNFTFQDKVACLAVYSKTVHAEPETLRPILHASIAEIQAE